MTDRGRPTAYQEEFVELARKVCQLGAIDMEVADILGVDAALIQKDGYRELAFRLVEVRADRSGFNAARKKKIAKRVREKMASRPDLRVRKAFAARIWAALKGKADKRLFRLLPYTLPELTAHLERGFKGGMTWENYGSWHVDHIKPCVLFDQRDKAQFQECWALSNLQPLWAGDNCRKGARYGEA